MTPLQLRRLMRRHRLTALQVAEMAQVSLFTVRAWLRPKTSKASRNMTPASAARLREATAARKPPGKAVETPWLSSTSVT